MIDDVTTITTKPSAKSSESSLFNVSIRAWLALMITATICALVLTGKPIDNNFAAQWGMILIFYFSQRERPKTQGGAS